MRFNHFVKLSGALLLTTSLAATASANNYGSAYNGQTAHEACKSDESRGKLIGGGLGAVAGAVFGSQVSGNGARTEGSVIGGVLGGLAGAGIADKRVDCDPVYSDGYQTSSSHTYSSGTYSTSPASTTYSSAPTYSTTSSSGYHQTASYQQPGYGTRTTVSDHPVYSDPTYGAQPARTYVSQPVSQPVYSQPTYQTASYSQPTYSSSSTHYVSSAPTTTYVRPVSTTYVQPTTYVRPRRAERRRRGYRRGHHHHGKYSCSSHH